MKKSICLIMSLFLLAGCTKPVEQGTVETEENQETVFEPKLDTTLAGELRIGGTFKNFEALEEIFSEFKEYYPAIETTYYSVDNQSDVLNKVIDGEEAPDIIFSNSYIFDYPDQYEDVQKNALVLNDPALGIDLDVINEELLQTNEKGEVVFYPTYILSAGVMVNEAILSANGIALPTTYDEFFDACEKLKEAGYAYPVVGCQRGDGWEALYPSLAQGYFMNQIYGKDDAVKAIVERTSDAEKYLRPVFAFIQEVNEKDVIDHEKSEALEDGYNSVIMEFFEGKIPFMLTNANTMTGTKKRESKSEAFQQNPFDYCFIPFPYDADGGTLPVFDTFGFMVNQKGPNKDIAIEFVRFLSQKKVLDEFCDYKGAPRITKDAQQVDRLAPLTAYGSKIQCDHQASLTREEALRVREAMNVVGNGGSADEALKVFFAE